MNAARVLESPVLVLNKNWAAIQSTTVKEAISLVAKGSAKIIDPHTYESLDLVTWNDVSRSRAKFGDAVIRSKRLALVPPEVIVLTNYDQLGERSVVFSRRNLFKRDKYCCQYCGIQSSPDSLTIDHVLPKSKGGVSSWTNCVLACLTCNGKKANRTPEQAKMPLRKIPKKPSWKALAQISPRDRKESWSQFISRAYWEIELEA